MVFIEDVEAHEVLDSRGNPTVRATVRLSAEPRQARSYQAAQALASVRRSSFVTKTRDTLAKAF